MRAFYHNPLVRFADRLRWRRRVAAMCAATLGGAPTLTLSYQARRLDLAEAFAFLEPEFGGAPVLCYEVVKRIVMIRRGIAPAANWRFIRAVLDLQPAFLMNHLSSRWVISVLDTVSDMAPPLEAAQAEALKNYFRGVRYGYSVLYQRADLARRPQVFNCGAILKGQEVWDGVWYFNYRGGDAFGNLFQRLNRVIADRPYLVAAAKRLHERLALHPVLGVPYRVNRPLREALGLPVAPRPPQPPPAAAPG